MKTLRLIIIAIAVLFFSPNCFSQLVVNAGNDTAFCDYDWEQASIGGDPTAEGGSPPYTYTWSAEYEYAGNVFTASFMLVDTTVANPTFKSPFNDSATFYLTVTDADQNTATDSVKVRFSSFVACLGECRGEISFGDSVQLGHCISGGIPPYYHSWTPVESLSDPTVENPWAKPQVTTTYELVLTDSIGCQTTSGCYVIVYPTGIQSINANVDQVQIFPNPSNGSITFIFDKSAFEFSVLKIFNVQGKLVKEISVDDAILEINVTDMRNGVYFYSWVKANEQAAYGKILIE